MERAWLWAALVALLALCLYLCTLAPGITWAHDGADGGDFAAAVASGGVPHPPGYPTYLLIAEAFRRLPWGDVAWRLNLLSATCAALAAGLVVILTTATIARTESRDGQWPEVITAPIMCGVCAGLLFAFTPVLWSQAVITEVYALHALFFTGLFALGLWSRAAADYRMISLSFFWMGLGLGNHLTLMLCLPGVLWLTRTLVRSNPLRFIGHALPSLAVGLSVYLVLPFRAAGRPPVNWGGADTLSGFWWLVSATAYRGFVFSLPLALAPARLVTLLRMVLVGVNGLGLPLAVMGLAGLLDRDRSLAAGAGLTFVLFSVYALFYNTADSYVYLIPTMTILVLWVGHGLHRGLRAVAARPRKRGVWAAALTGIALFSLAGVPWHWREEDLSTNTEALDYAVDALDGRAPNSLLIVSGDAHTFALWYAQYGLRLRPDVAVVNDSLVQFGWYRDVLQKYHPEILTDTDAAELTDLLLAEANVGRRQVFFTDKPESLPDGYRLEPSGNLWRMAGRGGG
jgi:hypothetical protein